MLYVMWNESLHILFYWEGNHCTMLYYVTQYLEVHSRYNEVAVQQQAASVTSLVQLSALIAASHTVFLSLGLSFSFCFFFFNFISSQYYKYNITTTQQSDETKQGLLVMTVLGFLTYINITYQDRLLLHEKQIK